MNNTTRSCPQCGNTVHHKSKESCYISKWKNSPCKECHSNKKLKNNCGRLLDNSLESYYWLGFLMADGHFNIKSRNIQLSIHNQDRQHLMQLKDYLSIETVLEDTKRNQVRLAFGKKSVFESLIQRFHISNTKTSNPPDLTSLSGDMLKAFNVGFIDGDGCITFQTGRKDPRITIRVHGAWVQNLQYMFGRGHLSNSGYAILCIGKFSEISDYKQFINNNRLPHLKRKWDKV